MSDCLEWGSSRIVVVIAPYVAIKVPNITEWRLFLHGLLANMQERGFSAEGWDELCPVIAACPLGAWVVMRYAKPLSDREWAEFDYEAFVDQPDYRVPAENKQSSFGILGNRIVAVDYG